MPEKKKEKKKSSQCCKESVDKIELVYEILSAHELSLKEIESKLEETSRSVKKVRGRMGL